MTTEPKKAKLTPLLTRSSRRPTVRDCQKWGGYISDSYCTVSSESLALPSSKFQRQPSGSIFSLITVPFVSSSGTIRESNEFLKKLVTDLLEYGIVYTNRTFVVGWRSAARFKGQSRKILLHCGYMPGEQAHTEPRVPDAENRTGTAFHCWIKILLPMTICCTGYTICLLTKGTRMPFIWDTRPSVHANEGAASHEKRHHQPLGYTDIHFSYRSACLPPLLVRRSPPASHHDRRALTSNA